MTRPISRPSRSMTCPCCGTSLRREPDSPPTLTPEQSRGLQQLRIPVKKVLNIVRRRKALKFDRRRKVTIQLDPSNSFTVFFALPLPGPFPSPGEPLPPPGGPGAPPIPVPVPENTEDPPEPLPPDTPVEPVPIPEPNPDSEPEPEGALLGMLRTSGVKFGRMRLTKGDYIIWATKIQGLRTAFLIDQKGKIRVVSMNVLSLRIP